MKEQIAQRQKEQVEQRMKAKLMAERAAKVSRTEPSPSADAEKELQATEEGGVEVECELARS